MLSLDIWESLVRRGVGRFEGELHLAIVPAPPHVHRVRVMDDGFAYVGSDGHRRPIHKGLAFDGASWPPEVCLVLGSPLSSCAAMMSAMHDDRYRIGDDGKDESDLLIFDAARGVGYGDAAALAIYKGLFIAGGSAWAANAAKRAACGADRARLLAWA